jgi:hypothetical protein
MEHTKTSFALSGLGVFIFAVVLTLATPSLFAQASARPSDVLGLALVGHQVADLERSIILQAIDFKVVEGRARGPLTRAGQTGQHARGRIADRNHEGSSSRPCPLPLVLRQYVACARTEQAQFLGLVRQPH